MRLIGRNTTRREASLRRRRDAGHRWRLVTPLLLIAIVCATAAYVGLDSWKKWHAIVPASSDGAVAPGRSVQGKVTSPSMEPGATTTRVSKCVADGATSYSDAGCPPDARASTLTVNPGENVASGLPPEVRRQVLGAPAPTASPAATIAGAPDAKSACSARDQQVRLGC